MAYADRVAERAQPGRHVRVRLDGRIRSLLVTGVAAGLVSGINKRSGEEFVDLAQWDPATPLEWSDLFTTK